MDLAVQSALRKVFAAFVATFLAARIVVLLIMTRRIPDLYVHAGSTHIHHLNYGILLLAGVGAYLLFRRPTGRGFSVAAVLYGIGLALTFDEFGMWLHLGGDYWTRASFDAIVIIGGLLALAIAAPVLKQFRPHHWITAGALAVAFGVFVFLLVETLRFTGKVVLPALEQIESAAPR
jgi:hypothetical protein